MMRALPILAAAVTLIALAPGAAARDRSGDLAKLTPVPGAKPESCISINRIRESRVIDDNTIDFYMTGGKQIYRNRLPQSCPQLGLERTFSYATSLSRLCSLDIITVLTRTGGGLTRGASCGLGEFQPVAKAR